MARGPASRFGQQRGRMASGHISPASNRRLMTSVLVLALLVPSDSFSLSPRLFPSPRSSKSSALGLTMQQNPLQHGSSDNIRAKPGWALPLDATPWKHTRRRGGLSAMRLKDLEGIDLETPGSAEKELDFSTSGPPPISWSEDGQLRFFGIDATAEVWAIALVYFVQGITGISRLAVSYYYKDALHIGPAELAIIGSIQILPWVVKPLYGFISDGFPLFGYKRRSYLILSGFTGALSWLGLAALATCTQAGVCPTDTTTTATAVAAVTLSSLGLAFSDVLVDAIVVTKSRGGQGQAGALQSLCWSSSAVGGILSAYASGSLVQAFGPRFVFGITAVFPLITTAVAGLIHETPVVDSKEEREGVFRQIKQQGGLLFNSFKEKAILLPVMFLVLWQATPTSGSALFYFETNELKFQPEFLGRLSLVSSLASLAGVVIYDQKLKKIPLRTLFKWTCLSGVVLGMTPLILVSHYNRQFGLPDTLFAIGDDVILTVLGQIAFMPVLVLGANICPPGVEASLYAALMSVNNLSGGLGNILGGLATKTLGVTESNFDNLPLLIVLTNLSGLLPLPFLFLLPEQRTDADGNLVMASESEDGKPAGAAEQGSEESAASGGGGAGDAAAEVIDVVARKD